MSTVVLVTSIFYINCHIVTLARFSLDLRTYIYLFCVVFNVDISSSGYIALNCRMTVDLWLCSHFVGSWSLFQFLNPIHSLDRGSARLKAATYTQDNTNRINAHKHSCLEWDSNPRYQCSSVRPRGHCDRRRVTSEQ
jgi:hypothetical protein